MMKINKLFAMMSVSAIPALAPAAVLADIHGSVVGMGNTASAPGAAGIFTLSAGPIPVTERTREGERKFMALEEAYARKLGWLPSEHSAAVTGDGQLALRATSKTLDKCDGGDCGGTDTD